MLPCSEFGPQKAQKSDESMNFVVGDFFVSKADEWRWNEDWEELENFWNSKQASATTPIRVGKHSASSGSNAASS